ncbi:oxidoreductase [Psychrosphaera sp. B3R10]|uniref:oxidoreductase n=3 Tax=Psychrosphaera TaxID=907197 RepID=UPI001C08C976|nr:MULTISPECIES: oxidoreductase [unclassified Psychrosphaera]MBU2988321.1 oxidoreductase [Psychrosphaera sp. B3R10]MDO6718531.1 oxidoreductase [Psychrosphaera sp. 1_MG-2023]
MIKVGVVGYGYSAKTFHIPLIQSSDLFEFSVISSSQKSLIEQTFPGVTVFESAYDLITHGDIELAIITAPNDVHYALAKCCLENGIHVVVEKPMVTTSIEAEALVELAKSRSLLLSVFHNRRWDGDFLTVKSLLANEQVGDVRLFESRYDRFRPTVRQRWREQPGPGAGIWFDLGAHLVDQAISLFGLPNALTARCLCLREGAKTTDYFHVLLHYKNLEVVLHGSSFSAAPNQRFRVEGTKGSFVKSGFDPQEAQLKNGLRPTDSNYGVESPEQFGCLYTEESTEVISTKVGCYQRYYTGIANAIRVGGDNPVHPEGVVNVLKILELAEKSSLIGKTLKLE